MIREPVHGAWVETAGRPQAPKPVTTVIRRTSATSCLCTRSVSPCSTIPSPTARQATLGRPRREAESAYGTGSATRLLLGADTNSRMRYGEGLGSPTSVVQPTVRRFATSGIRAAKAVSTVLDPVLGIVWTGHKKSRSTCGSFTVMGNAHYPDQVIGSWQEVPPLSRAIAPAPPCQGHYSARTVHHKHPGRLGHMTVCELNYRLHTNGSGSQLYMYRWTAEPVRGGRRGRPDDVQE